MKFTILVDKSTILSTKCTLIVYVSSYFNTDTYIVEFLDLIELNEQDAETIEKTLWLGLERVRISNSFASVLELGKNNRGGNLNQKNI